MPTHAFDKYINKKSPAKIKEEIRQEKRKIKADTRAKKEMKRKQKAEKWSGESNERNFFIDKKKSFPKRNFKTASSESDVNSGFDQKKSFPKRNYKTASSESSVHSGFEQKKSFPKRNFKSTSSESGVRSDFERKKSFPKRNFKTTSSESGVHSGFEQKKSFPKRSFKTTSSESGVSSGFERKKSFSKTQNHGSKNTGSVTGKKSENEQMPLNKFIAHSGVCGRREAADLVKQGLVKVNSHTVLEPAYKVLEQDVVELKGKRIAPKKDFVYILLNKPKDHITTTKDEKGRKTVLDLLRNIDAAGIYPVGRLDRNTTGVLLLTNDGELAQRLTHPSFQIKKIYEVGLNKPLTKQDIETIAGGVELEDGFIKADAVSYVNPKDKSVVGIEVHSGRNRIVRRIFEHLGYEVKKLDRVMFANLTKKNVERGKWRYLSEGEIRLLKYMKAGRK
jgi:23S rRNA pseudouridine2605 synthase